MSGNFDQFSGSITAAPGYTTLAPCAQAAFSHALLDAYVPACQPSAAPPVYAECLCTAGSSEVSSIIASQVPARGCVSNSEAHDESAYSVFSTYCSINAQLAQTSGRTGSIAESSHTPSPRPPRQTGRQNEGQSNGDAGGLSTGQTVGISVGVGGGLTVLVCLIGILMWLFDRERTKARLRKLLCCGFCQ